jgi:hypothetical protein
MSYEAIILLALAAGWWLLRSRPGNDRDQQRPKRAASRYPGAAIAFREDACPAVRALNQTRFLAWEAPSIPLPRCDAETCKCHYVCYKDRRQLQPDRRAAAATEQDPTRVIRAFERRERVERRAQAPVRVPVDLKQQDAPAAAAAESAADDAAATGAH